MTYMELFYKATRLIDNGKITLGEYEEMTKPLDREIEQEPCDDCCNGNQIEKAKLCQKSYIAGMEHKQEPKWIPCTERLPEKEYENYLVSTGDGEVDIGSYGSEKGWSMCDADGFYYPRHKGIEVVAWMPLPEPYKAESEE